jgi:hypothetical protein
MQFCILDESKQITQLLRYKIMIFLSAKQQAYFTNRSDEAATLLAKGFTTKAAKKSAQDSLNRAFDEVRSAMMGNLLSLRDAGDISERAMEAPYWGMPSGLSNWRPKHAPMLLTVDAGFQDLIDKADQLFKAREEVKATEVVKPTPKKKPTSTMSKSVGHKATHNGECQICGSEQKLPHGVLSLHGYTVDHGWFNGTCSGAKGQPYELSCDLIQAAVDSTKASIITYTAFAEELAVTTDYVWVNVSYRGVRGRSLARRAWEKHDASSIIVHTKVFSTDYELVTYFVEPEHILEADKGAYMTDQNTQAYKNLVPHGHVDSLDEAVIKANQHYLLVIKNTISQMETFVKWQEGRIANWELKELREV